MSLEPKILRASSGRLPLKLCEVPAATELEVVEELAEDIVSGGPFNGIMPPKRTEIDSIKLPNKPGGGAVKATEAVMVAGGG